MRLLILLVLTFGIACSSSAQTLDELISKSIVARGGIERLKSVKSLRMAGHISLGPNAAGLLIFEAKRPGKVREELQLDDKLIVRTSDGVSGWSLNPFSEKTGPEPLSAEEMSNMEQKADIDHPIVDYKQKGYRVELLGKDTVEDHVVYKLKVTLKNDQIRYDYLDANTGLSLKWEGKIVSGGKEINAQSYFTDYRDVEGRKYPFHVDSSSEGSDIKQTIVFDKIEINPAIDDSRFGKPTAPETTPKP